MVFTEKSFLLTIFSSFLIFLIQFVILTEATERHPDFYLSFNDTIKKYGYKIDYHEVTTDDGYIINFFNIFESKKNIFDKPVIYFMHSLFASGEIFFLGGKNSCIPYNFIDNGYDVWIGNTRGNKYGKKHINMSSSDSNFWKYSWHEIGIYDLPAQIDYILNKKQIKKLYYVSYSQGGTLFYVLNSMRQEYQEKFIQASLLGPSAYMKELGGSKIISFIFKFLIKMGIYELPPYWINVINITEAACDLFKSICDILQNNILGISGETNFELVPVILKTISSCSTYQIIHYYQNMQSGEFRQYDFGEAENLKIYKNETPPSYQIENIKTPIAVYYGNGDLITSSKDVIYACDKIPGCIQKFKMKNPKWTHFDFLLSKNLKENLIFPLIENIKQFN